MTHKIDPAIRLGELKLKVSSLERSVKFYTDVIGFKVLHQENNRAHLTVDGANTFLVLVEVKDAVIVPPRSASGLYHFAVLLPTRKDLGVILRHLIQNNIEIGQADHLVSEALYISDPDHNGIEIYRDRPREEWEWDDAGHVKMATEPIDWQGILAEGEGEEWSGLPIGTTLGHIHLHVSDLQKSKWFYCDVLGLDIVADWSLMHALFISAGGYHHHIGMNMWAGIGAPLAPSNGTGLSYYTIEVPDWDNLGKTLERLREHGISVDEVDEAWHVKDPSGILVRLVPGKDAA